MATPEQQPLSKFRERWFPIHQYEMVKFLPMLVLIFCMAIGYTTLRGLKDSLIATAPHSSAKVFPWLKMAFVTPAAVGFFVIYSELSNRLSKETLYSSVLIVFMAFFAVFGFVIYPLRDVVQVSPDTLLRWQQNVPMLENLFPVFGYWGYSLFYIMTELWGSIGIVILFWQFANQVCTTAEAKRFYTMFGLGSQLATICAGLLLQNGKHFFTPRVLPSGEKDFSGQLFLYIGVVVVLGIVALLTYWWMERKVLTNPLLYKEANLLKKGKEKKPKMSLGESLKCILHSRYLGYIAILVLGYNICINLVEVSWKDQVKLLYPDKGDFTNFMGSAYIYVGTIGLLAVMFLKNITRKFGWYVAAIITPLVGFVGATFFYGTAIFTGLADSVAAMIGMTALQLSVWLGLFHNVFTKAAKYALFDPSKEMTYIPLEEDLKVKGKVAVDVIGGRAGKAGGGTIQIFFQMVLGAFHAMGAYMTCLFGAFAAVGGIWIWVVGKLSGEYEAKTKENEAEEKAHSK